MIVDLFCGAGGASHGIELALGRSPDVAIDRDAVALEMHAANHPGCRHVEDDVTRFDPAQVADPVEVMWLSPDCRHFSRAKGSRPVSDEVRGLAWAAVKWARVKRPKIIFLENVEEFLQWGPLDENGVVISDKKGLTFAAWVGALRDLGYVVGWRVLNCADYGAPTSRKRLFLIARCDGAPIVWPEPTHGPGRPIPWGTGADCIDWTIPAPSIFERKRELADKTKRRVAHGVMRHVVDDPKPFIAPIDGQDVSAFFVPRYGERPTQEPRSRDVRRPMPVVVPSGNGAQLVAAFLVKHYGGVVGHRLDRPVGSITARDSQGIVTAELAERGGGNSDKVAAFLTVYYGAERGGQRLDIPVRTIPTRDRFGLVTVRVSGEEYVVSDIGMRMLKPHELARAQGFPAMYRFPGATTQQTAKIGNSVPPPVVAALVGANCGIGGSG